MLKSSKTKWPICYQAKQHIHTGHPQYYTVQHRTDSDNNVTFLTIQQVSSRGNMKTVIAITKVIPKHTTQ